MLIVPIAVLLPPVVTFAPALDPKKVQKFAVVKSKPVLYPTAVFCAPDVKLLSDV